MSDFAAEADLNSISHHTQAGPAVSSEPEEASSNCT